jgi:hypothetical protein
VRLAAPPAAYSYYFPEGFSSPSIREFLSIGNPNDATLVYTITLHYETGDRDQVLVENGQIERFSRGGITISDGPNGTFPGVRAGSPYSIVITSNLPLGATLAHYDFGLSLGESLTPNTSTTWAVAKVQKLPGLINDFLVYYNPNPTDTVVTFTFFTGGGNTVSVTQFVGGFRRGGLNINDTAAIPVGVMGVMVTSRPVNAADSHAGVVVSLSHYDTVTHTGYAALADREGGTTSGVIPSLIQGATINSEFSLFNPGSTTANVTITGTYIRSPLPQIIRTVQVPAGGVVTLTGTDLAFVPNQPIGLRFASNVPVSAIFNEIRSGAATGTTAATEVGQDFFFGDAFINTGNAGTLYLETLTFFNPGALGANISIKLLFSDGTQSQTTVSVGPGGFAQYDLHTSQLILGRPGNNFFSIEVSSASNFAVYQSHYDLFLGGGFGTKGAPFGLLNSLSRIS